jgi:hypothetical protein
VASKIAVEPDRSDSAGIAGGSPEGCRVEIARKKGGLMSIFGRTAERGKIGYIILWLMGVPASILFLIFLLRGCN